MTEHTFKLDTIADAVSAVGRGELVVVVDDTDRENEGDLIMAAETATPERMAFMIRHTSGIICAPMAAERAERLQLPPMVANNLDPMRTAFTVSVDAKRGMTTGISAIERTNTVRALAGAGAQAGDFLRPGHVFPLIGRAGGVLTRSGHTEAAIDLATMAGLSDVAVLAEVVNDDGTVKRLDELIRFAREHGLRIVTIEDLIAARVQSESLVQRLSTEQATIDGHAVTVHAYATKLDPWQHIAVVFGDLSGGMDVPCRIHREQPVRELIEPGFNQIGRAFEIFRQRGRGVFIVVRNPDVATAAPQAAVSAGTGEHHQSAEARKTRWRDIGVGAQILRDLGVRSIAVLSAHEHNYIGLVGHGISVTDKIAI
ncbi:3,4-dihydroxy-2-butanone-4-phosphate synthase [Lichenihabitans psoromatis]|uniref:3,4-dihydroxy-2-butanone-4-phosphate synthase n=1 Tax=Lichenihabitans psoromatis TaxID=2528642 RepID=UPI001038425B|nr:3,4-dihydroxy-2-butanone-4-phosphate synthase [Lichenihabitans psoromatis]